ncbi:MAG: DUF2892 domain-containing protein [Proteobacteria bacterium]|nr:DUF2892 domain-containing protein [Pseudomonadota bacterium]
MKRNVGNWDRIFRGCVAVILAYLVFAGRVGGFWAVIFGIGAFIMAATAVSAYCFAYTVLGINTCRLGGCGQKGQKR